ncbi:MAG TPA: C25 family cysteine peptidase [Bacteroidales bacterium]|nr:C25 family cysteine peptidase [Bacteroidales bacterium]
MKKILLLCAILGMGVNSYSASLSHSEQPEGTAFRVNERAFSAFVFRNTVGGLQYSLQTLGGQEYTRLTLPGYIRDLSRSGHPDLPVLSRLIEIPEGASVAVEVLSRSTRVVSLAEEGYPHPLIPVQPSVFKDQDPALLPVVKDEAAYAMNGFSEQKLVRIEEVGRMRGVRVARLVCSPFRYHATSHTLEITTDMEVRVSFPGADPALTREMRRKFYSPFFEVSFNSLINHGAEMLNDTSAIYPMKYVIVSSPMFQAALQPFIAWKREMGYTVIEAYTSDPLVGTTTTSIKNYLLGLYNAATSTDPAPTFALLVGDVAQIPAYSGTTGTHPSDLYYFEYDGGSDYLPELFYGRFSANNLTELQPQIDKTLEYERYLMPSDSFLGEVVMVAGMDNSFGPTHANGQINYGTANYFNAAHNMLSHTYLYPASGSNASAIIGKVSSGVGFVNYTAHCGTNGWADPSFTSSNIPSLQNTSEYPLIIGNCCLSNKFDGSCFGEDLLRASGKGAVGYIGGSNSTLWDEDYYWSVGVGTPNANPTYAGTGLGAYDRLFHDHGEPRSEWYETNGQIIMAGNLAVTASTSNEDKYYWEIYHLMGDPSLRNFYGIPPALNISHAPAMPVGLPFFNVSTEPYTYVALSVNGVLHGAGMSDSLGALPLLINPITIPGPAKIVATRMNRKPYIDSIMVVAPNGPYLGLNSYITADPTGNNNGKPDFGETVQLGIQVQNFGNQDAGVVTARLSTLDSLVTLIDSMENAALITAGDTLLLGSAFSFAIDPYIPDQHLVQFHLLLSDSAGGAWTYPVKVVLNAPRLMITSMEVDDQVLGNGNGSIDPGESIEISVVVGNTGHCDATAPFLSLVTYSPLASVTAGTTTLPNLVQGGQQAYSFAVQVSGSAQAGDFFELIGTLISGLYTATLSFSPVVGTMVEDWETGGFGKFAWQQGGSMPWTVVNTGAWEGTYCAASGNIPHSASSELTVQVNVLMNDSISFYRKVSSEDGYDYLIFSIDGVPADQWSGVVGWSRVSYPVNPGPHTFRWSYEKDWWVASGSDKAWIDYIEFPVVAGVTTGVTGSQPAPGLEIFPNPAGEEARISVFLPLAGDHSLELRDGSGRLVMELAEGMASSGYHAYAIPVHTLEAGVYFLRMVWGQEQLVKKLVVVR